MSQFHSSSTTASPTQSMGDLTRIIEFTPAFDKRDPDSHKNFGIHGVEMRLVVKGAAGAVQFLLYTNWQLAHVRQELCNCGQYCRNAALPADLGYHSKLPRHENEQPAKDHCDYTGGPCYYDGSTLAAERIFDVLCMAGDTGVWRELETYYHDIFDRAEPV